jgi:hypothetical protein
VIYAKTLAIALAAVAALLFAQEAHGQGCRVGQAGCSVQAAGCSTQAAGCSVSAVPAAVSANDVVTFRPRPRTAPVTQTQPQVVQGPAGPAGPQGPAGPPGEITQAHIDAVVSQVAAKLLPQMISYMESNPAKFRGEQGPTGEAGSYDPAALASAVKSEVSGQLASLPPIKVEFLGDGDRVASTQNVSLGGKLQIPAITIATENPDGSMAHKTAAIGSSFKVKFDKF